MHTQRADSFDHGRESATGRDTSQSSANHRTVSQPNTPLYATNKDVPFAFRTDILRTNTDGNGLGGGNSHDIESSSSTPFHRLDTNDGPIHGHGQTTKKAAVVPIEIKALDELQEFLKRTPHTNISYMTDELLNTMAGFHKEAANPQSVLDDIVHLLQRHDSHSEPASLHTNLGYVDDCIRWSLFVKVLEPNLTLPGPSYKAVKDKISAWSVDHAPDLAFAQFFNNAKDAKNQSYPTESRRHSEMSTYFRRHCPTGRHKGFAVSTPFHIAAEQGNHLLLTAMFQNAEAYYDKQLRQLQETTRPETTTGSLTDWSMELRSSQLKVVVKADPGAKSGQTAFCHAVRGACNPYETLQVLLKFTGPDTPPNDKGFIDAIDGGLDLAVEAFLDAGVQLEPKIFAKHLLKALGKLEDDVEDWASGRSVRSVHGCRLNIVKSFVRRADVPEKFNKKIVQEIIERNLVEVWDLKCDNVPVEKVKESLLHLAVLHQRDEFVERFVDAYPSCLKIRSKVPENGSHEKMFPLWYNNHVLTLDEDEVEFIPNKEWSTARTRIRDTIVTKMIHLLDLEDLTDILHRSSEPFDDLSFDLSRFNTRAFPISEFITSIISQDKMEQQCMLRYEHTLKYVEFPPLDMAPEHRETFKESTHLAANHDEVFRILDWLASKGVTKIIRLVVPDRLVNPHDEIRMANYVRRFQVEILDWRVLDLALSIFKGNEDLAPSRGTDLSMVDKLLSTLYNPQRQQRNAKISNTTSVLHVEDTWVPNKNGTKGRGASSGHHLKDLTLYASGKRSAIYHWFNATDGILSLGLERIQIYVIRETCTSNDTSQLLDEIYRLQKERLPNTDTFTAFDPLERAWYPAPSPADLSKIAERLSKALAAWLVKLVAFANKRATATDSRLHPRPTRVAILDNGVLSISPMSPEAGSNHLNRNQGSQPSDISTGAGVGGDGSSARVDGRKDGARPNASLDPLEQGLWSRIKAGRSFVDSASKFCPWQFPSDPHGTQMANLICAIDPLCEIYVARVAEDAVGIKPDNVAKAIEWAIQNDVDIISMSFVLGEDSNDVREKVEQASNRGIIMTCSTHDEGSRTRKAYPASYRTYDSCDSVIVLAACDHYGKLLREPDSLDHHYKLIGDRVPAGMVPFVNSEEHISGSSVATALAAGLCSLILTCDRLADPDKTYVSGSMREEKLNGRTISKSNEDYRLGVVKGHLNEMQTSTGSTYVDINKFGNISEPVVGDDKEPSRAHNAGRIRTPTVLTVLKDTFKMSSSLEEKEARMPDRFN